MVDASERFCHNVSKLALGGHMTKGNQALQKLFSHKVTIELDVLGPFMEDGVLGNVNCCLIVTLERYGSDGGDSELIKQPAQPG